MACKASAPPPPPSPPSLAPPLHPSPPLSSSPVPPKSLHTHLVSLPRLNDVAQRPLHPSHGHSQAFLQSFRQHMGVFLPHPTCSFSVCVYFNLYLVFDKASRNRCHVPPAVEQLTDPPTVRRTGRPIDRPTDQPIERKIDSVLPTDRL